MQLPTFTACFINIITCLEKIFSGCYMLPVLQIQLSQSDIFQKLHSSKEFYWQDLKEYVQDFSIYLALNSLLNLKTGILFFLATVWNSLILSVGCHKIFQSPESQLFSAYSCLWILSVWFNALFPSWWVILPYGDRSVAGMNCTAKPKLLNPTKLLLGIYNN